MHVGKILEQRATPFLQRDYEEVSLNFDQTDMDLVSSHTPEKKLFPARKAEKKTIPDSRLETFLAKRLFVTTVDFHEGNI